MEKHMNADTVTSDWQRILLDVAQDDNTIIIEQDGEPIAALVPVQAYKHLRRVQEASYDEEHHSNRRRSDIRDETAD
ncbi:MAG: hypothetical protein WCD37_08110 [Chloroflexia bacterium]